MRLVLMQRSFLVASCASSTLAFHSFRVRVLRHYSTAPRLCCYNDERFSSAATGAAAAAVAIATPDPYNQNSIDCQLDACWDATSWTVNAADDERIGNIVRCFNSPAPQSYFALCNALQNAATVDEQKQVLKIFDYTLKEGYRFAFRNGSDWTIYSIKDGKPVGWTIVEPLEMFPNTLSIAHHLLELTVEASDRQEPIARHISDSFVEMAIQRLRITLGTDIRGRSSADAAFLFAMAGIVNSELYHLLTKIAKLELRRTGARPSFPSKNILQFVEKLAAAGIRGKTAQDVYHIAADYLFHKGEHEDIADALRKTSSSSSSDDHDDAFGLHSTRSLLWLWRFAARQSKAKLSSTNGNDPKEDNTTHDTGTRTESTTNKFNDEGWTKKFGNNDKPLIIDIGCGMGVSTLGLATMRNSSNSTIGGSCSVNLEECNFVGNDLSHLLVQYASGVAERWGISERSQFVWKPALSFLDDVRKYYPGPVPLVMIQFPTPFRLKKDKHHEVGNSQLPSEPSSGFMVSMELLQLAADILKSSSGVLLLQSNCDDVAIFMHDLAKQVGMVPIDADQPVETLKTSNDLPKRTLEWIAMDGKRPIGSCWSSVPLLPRRGHTETEVACTLEGKPVHRCLYRVE